MLSRLVEIRCVCHYIYAGESFSCSVVSDSATRWTVAFHGILQAILQGIFPTQGSNPGLLYCRQILYHLSHQGSQASFFTLLFDPHSPGVFSSSSLSAIRVVLFAYLRSLIFLQAVFQLVIYPVQHFKWCTLEPVGYLISGSSAFSKPSLFIWNFSIQVLLKPRLKDLEHNLTGMWNECNCMGVWTFFGVALLLDWNEDWLFPVLWPLLSFPNLLTYWVKHFNSIIF